MKKLMMLPARMFIDGVCFAGALGMIALVFILPLMVTVPVCVCVALGLMALGVHHETAGGLAMGVAIILMPVGIVYTREMFFNTEEVKVRRGVGVSRDPTPQQAKKARGWFGKLVWHTHALMVEGYCYLSIMAMGGITVLAFGLITGAVAWGPFGVEHMLGWKIAGGGAIVGLIIHTYLQYQISETYTFVKLPPWETGEEEWV